MTSNNENNKSFFFSFFVSIITSVIGFSGCFTFRSCAVTEQLRSEQIVCSDFCQAKKDVLTAARQMCLRNTQSN